MATTTHADANLLEGLDGSFWDTTSTPGSSPVKAVPAQLPDTCSRPRMTSLPPRSNTEPHRSLPSPSKVFSAGHINTTDLLEGVNDWDFDSESEPSSPKKPLRSQTQSNFGSRGHSARNPCSRCIVQEVHEETQLGRHQKRLVVKLDTKDKSDQMLVILRDDWARSDIRIGDVVNILGTFKPSLNTSLYSIIIDAKENTLILHPDILLTATSLSNTPQCRRKPLLSTLVHSSSDITPSLVWGNMLHEVMQSCFTEGHWEDRYITNKIDEVVKKGLPELVKIEVPVEQAKYEVATRAKGIQAFAAKYIADSPKPNGVINDGRSEDKEPSLLAITNMLDVEEDIWSPTYGLKGKLDVTVQAQVSDPVSTAGPLSMAMKKPQRMITVGPRPFEIKTGRATAGMEHRAQTMLYTLLAAERYGEDVPAGLLFYTQSEEVVRVPAGRNELRALIGARNEMAAYTMTRARRKGGKKEDEYHEEEEVGYNEEVDIEDLIVQEPFLPETIDNERTCLRCYAVDTCMLYRKAVENVEDTTSPIADLYKQKTGHLTKDQMKFFKKWEALLALEEQDLVRFKRELWTMGAEARESKGRCFSNMLLTPTLSSLPLSPGTPGGKIHRFRYTFSRTSTYVPAPSMSSKAFFPSQRNAEEPASLLNGHLGVGDPITISVEPELLALARGYIVELAPAEVVVGVDHELNLEAIASRLRTLRSGSPPPQSSYTSLSPSQSNHDEVVFRIDKDEYSGGMGRIRDNLAQLFYVDGDKRRLELVVDLRSPEFENPLTAEGDSSDYAQHLNKNQRRAVRLALAAKDYALILGMPGTGKTTVIAALIRKIVSMGKTVLLTSHTHSAVDTIVAKLKDDDFGILRLGNGEKIHPDVRKYSLAARKPATCIEELERQLMGPPVVATTCLSIDNALFTRRKFDYCIVDEASQITLPTCLGPLRYADKFVLVGDHFQLPPLVRNRDARKGGLDMSLFRRLSDAHPHAVVDLTYQYRMNADIMSLSNTLIYGRRLRCGSEQVAAQSLKLPNRQFLSQMHREGTTCSGGPGCWIRKVVADSRKALFVDTDGLPAFDSRLGDLVQNEVEAHLVYQVAETLLRCGVGESQLGVLSLYRQQVKLLSHLLQDRKGVEILTADRSQGRDKECILISMVRSNEGGAIGELLKDWRRINVAFTRARSKLIIFGSRKTLQGTPLLNQFFQLMGAQEWILHLPPGAHKMHPYSFDVAPLSTTAESEGLGIAERTWDGGNPQKHKRRVDAVELDHLTLGKENILTSGRPSKKPRRPANFGELGNLRGRPVLMDLVHEDAMP